MTKQIKKTIAGTLAAAGLVVALAGANAFAAEKDVAKTLQDRVAKLTPEQQAALLALLDQMPAAKESKTASSATPEDAMRLAIKELETAKAEKKFSLDTFTAHISKDFDHDGVGKDGARSFLEGILGAVSVNGVPDITVSLDGAKYKVTGDKAEVYPVNVSAPIGAVTLTIYGKLEDGVWRVVGVDGI